jgi:hypothetical protein
MSTQYQTFLYLFIFRSIPNPCFHDSLFESEALRFQIASAFYSNGKYNDYQVKILYSRWLLQCLPPVSLTSPTITIRRVHLIHSQKPYEIAVMGPPTCRRVTPANRLTKTNLFLFNIKAIASVGKDIYRLP